jgi:integrase
MKRQQGLYRRRNIFCFRYKDQDDGWKEKSTGTADRCEAIAFKQQWEEDLKNDERPTDKAEWTVEQACSMWVQSHVLGSAKAEANERSLLRQLLRSALAQKRLRAITLDDLKSYQSERSNTVGPRAVNLELRILINVLKEENLWRRSLSKHYRRLKEPEAEIGRALSLDDLRKLEAVAAARDAWMVAYCCEQLAANTGMRGGEIKQLRRGGVDLEHRRITVTRDITKSDAGARKIELNVSALSATTKLYQRAETLGATAPDHFLLPADQSRHTRKNDPLRGMGFDVTHHQMSWRSAWRSLTKEAGFPGLRFHDLRHSFITLMAEHGVPLPVVQSMVGHMSPQITRHYTHISNEAARRAVELLDQKPADFVDVFVDTSVATESTSVATENSASKLLN